MRGTEAKGSGARTRGAGRGRPTTAAGRESAGAADEFSGLLERARRGERAALDALYRRYAGRVLAAVRPRLPRSLRAKYDTLDFAHSVFAEVLHDLPRIEDRGEGAFVQLLRIKAVNKIRRKLKRHLGRDGRRAEARLSTSRDAPGREPGPDAVLGTIEDDVRLHRLLAELDAPARDTLRLRAEGLAFAEIATRLGMPSADAARKRHARALADVRSRWGRRL